MSDTLAENNAGMHVAYPREECVTLFEMPLAGDRENEAHSAVEFEENSR